MKQSQLRSFALAALVVLAVAPAAWGEPFVAPPEDNPNITTFEDSYTLYDTFLIKKIGGHCAGSCAVSFDYKNKKYVLTGDECYLNENIDQKRPIGINVDVKKNADFINSLKETYDVIYTFHNPEIVRDSSNIERLV